MSSSADTTVQHLLGLEGPIDENTLPYRLKGAGYKQSVPLHRVTQALARRVNRAAEFFAETLQRVPPAPGGYVVRADSGFFGERFLSATTTWLKSS